MAATYKGTAMLFGIGSTALANLIPLEYTMEGGEVSEVVKDGHGAATTRIIKDTFKRYTLRGNYNTMPSVTEGTALAFTTAENASVTGYVESVRVTRNENPAVIEITVIKETGITYS